MMSKEAKRQRFKAVVFMVLVIFLTVNSNLWSAWYDKPENAPVDSIVVWFNDYCNQNQQVRAFFQILKNKNYYGSPFLKAEIEPDYDLPQVRDAFAFFVRSITVNNQSSGCTEFFPSYWLGNRENEPANWEQEPITDLVLSLYAELGYTIDLYEIADILYDTHPWEKYMASVWNQLGTGYLQHLETEIQTDPDHLLAISIAGRYLRLYPTPLETMSSIAVNILHLAAISPSREQRRWVGFELCDVYLKGYNEVRADILLLSGDPDEGVKNRIRGDIRFKQESKHQMMNFLNDE